MIESTPPQLLEQPALVEDRGRPSAEVARDGADHEHVLRRRQRSQGRERVEARGAISGARRGAAACGRRLRPRGRAARGGRGVPHTSRPSDGLLGPGLHHRRSVAPRAGRTCGPGGRGGGCRGHGRAPPAGYTQPGPGTLSSPSRRPDTAGEQGSGREELMSKRVITYGTFDLFHEGHVRLLERAKALGDYLIVGVTTENYDSTRGKLNVRQSLMERIHNVQQSGLADEVIIEEYEGQKINDIQRYGVDIFAIGSDWLGKFDYLNDYCKVVYLDRTKGVSSTQLRDETGHPAGRRARLRPHRQPDGRRGALRLGRHRRGRLEPAPGERAEVRGRARAARRRRLGGRPARRGRRRLRRDAARHPRRPGPAGHRGRQARALREAAHPDPGRGARSCTRSPSSGRSCCSRRSRPRSRPGSSGWSRSRAAGRSARCARSTRTFTKLVTAGRELEAPDGGAISELASYPLLAVIKLLGTGYSRVVASSLRPEGSEVDTFSRIDLTYPHAVASARVGLGVKAEGDLVVAGTRGYIYVPAPWWKTEYFEARFEDQRDNKKYYFKFDGDGLRYEVAEFASLIRNETPGVVQAALLGVDRHRGDHRGGPDRPRRPAVRRPRLDRDRLRRQARARLRETLVQALRAPTTPGCAGVSASRGGRHAPSAPASPAGSWAGSRTCGPYAGWARRRCELGGWAYERGYGHADAPPSTPVWLERGGRRIEADRHAALRPRGQRAPRPRAASYDYANTAFTATFDARPAAGAQAGRRPWIAHVRVIGAGRDRTGTFTSRYRLGSVRHLFASHPPDDVQLLVPAGPAVRGWTLRAAPAPAVARSVELDGRTRVGAGLHRRSHAHRRLRCAAARSSRPRLHAGGPRRRRPAAVPADRHRARDHPAGHRPRRAALGRARGPGPHRRRAETRRWRPPWTTPRPSSCPARRCCVSATAGGRLVLLDAPGRVLVDEVTVSERPPGLALSGRYVLSDVLGDPLADGEPPTLVLAGARQVLPVEATFATTGDGQGTWRAWAPAAGLGLGPAPAATPARRLRHCGPGRRDGVVLPVSSVPAITRRMPEVHHLEGFRLRLQAGGGRSMRFSVSAPRRDDELGSFHQRRLERLLPQPDLEPAQRRLPRELLRARRDLQPVRHRPGARRALPAADPVLGGHRRVGAHAGRSDHGGPWHPRVVARPGDLALRGRERLAAPHLLAAAVPGRPADLARLDAQEDRPRPVRAAQVQDRDDPARAVEVGRPALPEPPQQRDPGVRVRLAPDRCSRRATPATTRSRPAARTRATARRSAPSSASSRSRQRSSTPRPGARTSPRW